MCRFSNLVSYSQIKCHHGVIYDIEVRRIGPQRTTSASIGEKAQFCDPGFVDGRGENLYCSSRRLCSAWICHGFTVPANSSRASRLPWAAIVPPDFR